MTFAVIFPGQGAAAPGAGAPWVDHAAWQVVREAEAATGRPLARLLLEADGDELATTGPSQMAVLLTSLVAWHALSEVVPGLPVAFAGHSLGQVTALVASGTVAPAEGYRLAQARADASQRSADARPGRMAALMGTDPEAVAALCAEGDDAWVANDNAPGQVVVAGTPEGVDALAERARATGIRKVMPLAVGHAFHTPLLADAAAALAPTLARTTFRAGVAPVITNTDAAPAGGPGSWPDLLRRHLVEPVRWRETQLALAGLGATAFVEVGPGRVLAGLAKRTVPDIAVHHAATPDDLPAVADALARAADPTPTGAAR